MSHRRPGTPVPAPRVRKSTQSLRQKPVPPPRPDRPEPVYDVDEVVHSFTRHRAEAQTPQESIIEGKQFVADQRKFGGLPKPLRFPVRRRLSPSQFQQMFESKLWQRSFFSDAVMRLVEGLHKNNKNSCIISGMNVSITLHRGEWALPTLSMKEVILFYIKKCTNDVVIFQCSIHMEGNTVGHANLLIVDKKRKDVRLIDPHGDSLPLSNLFNWPPYLFPPFTSSQSELRDFAESRLDPDTTPAQRAGRIAYLAVRHVLKKNIADPLGFDMEIAPSCPIQTIHENKLLSLDATNWEFLTQGGLCSLWSLMTAIILIRLPRADISFSQNFLSDYVHANSSNTLFTCLAFLKHLIEAIDMRGFAQLRQEAVANL